VPNAIRGSVLALAALACLSAAPSRQFTPASDATLLNPRAEDWLMFSRTYDNQRFSPLDQIDRTNVRQLRMAWSRGLPPGVSENIPIVYQGVMFTASAPAIVQALDATNGDLLWEYRRKLPADIGKFVDPVGRTRILAIYDDMLFYAAPDGFLVALDLAAGALRWETRVHDYTTATQHTSGPMIASGKVITGRNCGVTRDECFIAAHEARTGKLLWKFHTAPAPGEPGGDTWGDMPAEKRLTSPWGLPGSFDPRRNLVYWGTANPSPHTRMKRHNGDPEAISRSAPAELYSNSTLALNPDTGKLAWYYQHLPGDDWDSDHVQERILLRTRLEPDRSAVKWINPKIRRGEERDVVVQIGEPGGLWMLDRTTGEFLWATPFPFDTPHFHISNIDVETGRAHINWNLVLKKDGETHTVCYNNTKSYWPMAYDPTRNALYVPYHDECAERVGDSTNENGHRRKAVLRPGGNLDAFTGIAKVDMASGRVERFYTQRFPGNGAILATAGGLIFWGDVNRRLRAFDADTGSVLWEGIVGGITQTSTITYAVNGRQYIAIRTGQGQSGTSGPMRQVPELNVPRDHNALYVFALPEGI
jgi:alcohol dehydrogenase (cytochrome c)